MTTKNVKRKLRAILSADVQGYSRLMGDDEVATVKTITEYRETLSSIVNKYNGRVVDSPGDNVLAEFGSVVDAVQCAVEIQNVLKAKNEGLPENRRMVFRIGVNLGDVIQEEERIYGDGVNIAARIEGLADGGGICISGTAYDQIENKLALGYNFIGEHTVKNIKKPIRVYKVPMDPKDVGEKRVGKSWKKMAIAAAVLLILTGAAAAIWNFYPPPAPTPTEVASKKTSSPESQDKPVPLPDKPSIAVLPFANISGDPKEDYLSDGITEQIISALSKTPRMLVIARNSVFTYKGKPVMVQQVSEELGVRYVLEGSVQKSGDKLRITAQLIDARTGNHLWSERYDRGLKDLFDLQDDITKNVIMALQVKLTQGEIALLGKGTKNLEAYLKVMKGLHHVLRFNKNDNEIGRRLYGEAISLDPNYASAYVRLALTYYNEAFFGWTKTSVKSYEKAMELAKKAIFLDDQNAGAYMVFANIYVQTGQFEKAAAAQKEALALDPANSLVNAMSGGALSNAGKFTEAIPFLRKAISIDPKHPSWYLQVLGMSYFWTVQNEEAIAVFKKLVSREPKNADAYAAVGFSLTAAGKPQEAIAMFEKALSLNPDGPAWHSYHLSIARLWAGQSEEAITMLREALSRDPENAEVCLWLSVALTSEGKYEEALSMAKKAVKFEEINPGPGYDANFYFFLGVPYLMMGQYAEAIAAFKKAISLSPEYLYAHINLTAAYSMAGRIEKARAEAAEVLKINPKITLEDIDRNGYFNYKRADKERFINALRKAGLK